MANVLRMTKAQNAQKHFRGVIANATIIKALHFY
jgi:hypothetical protein